MFIPSSRISGGGCVVSGRRKSTAQNAHFSGSVRELDLSGYACTDRTSPHTRCWLSRGTNPSAFTSVVSLTLWSRTSSISPFSREVYDCVSGGDGITILFEDRLGIIGGSGDGKSDANWLKRSSMLLYSRVTLCCPISLKSGTGRLAPSSVQKGLSGLGSACCAAADVFIATLSSSPM